MSQSSSDRKTEFIIGFENLRNTDVGLVGGKNASLGEMYSNLGSKGKFCKTVKLDLRSFGSRVNEISHIFMNLFCSFVISKGVQVPYGFAVTAYSYFHFLRENKIEEAIRSQLKSLDIENIADLQTRGAACRELILNSPWPTDLATAIMEAYAALEKKYGRSIDVAVRSSATAEDLPDASFAGQQVCKTCP